MNWSIETLLTVHIIVVTLFLMVMALLLLRRSLFRWNAAGFWAWVSFALYYVLNPLTTLRSGDLNVYRSSLSLAGGVERGQWILFVLLLGMMAFFLAYLRTSAKPVVWRLQGDSVSLPMFAGMVLFIVLSLYSLFTQRSLVVATGRATIIESGRFIGEVSGYENAGYMFLIVPILMLVLSKSHGLRGLGWLSTGLFMLLSLPSGWSRFALVSILIALSLADVLQRKAAWPRWFFIPILLILTLALQLRGHTEWTLAATAGELVDLSGQVTQNLGEKISSAIGSEEVSALATWYLESYVIERYLGYSYGLPILNYAATGWIPSRLLPQKYFLIDWVASQQIRPSVSVVGLLYGAKSSLLGSFYGEGGLFAVLIMAAITGFLSRKLDGMLHPDSPLLVRATGVAWMSVLWMIWQSSDTWGIMALGILGLPTLVMWLLAPKVHRPKVIRKAVIKESQWVKIRK